MSSEELDNAVNLEITPDVKDVKKTKVKKKTGEKKKEEKKKPGRPRLTPHKIKRPIKGVVDKPSNDAMHIELVHDNPVIMKKIWGFFKQMEVSKLHIQFRPESTLFYSQDHYDKSKVMVKIDTTKIHSYYCAEKLDVGVLCSKLNPYISKIDKTYDILTIVSNRDALQKRIEFTYKTFIQIDEIHNFNVIGDYNKFTDEDEEEFFQDDYCLHLQFPYQRFKKYVTDIKNAGARTIDFVQDDKDSPFCIQFEDKNGTKSTYISRNLKKIGFVSKLKDDESFRVSFKIDYIKPIISIVQLSDTIDIYADENKKLMCVCKMDGIGATEVRLLIPINGRTTG